ncbi:MAG: HD domain-containing protein [Lachnospiraceae bacterium]|nr:HD domain-containing protein [Lachnospiraceae bacterium]
MTRYLTQKGFTGRKMDEELKKTILEYAQPAIDSEVFKAARKQIHHRKTTVARHIMRVTAVAADIASKLNKEKQRVDMKDVIIAAVCHDLGIVGRYEKYRNDVECCLKHPKDSLIVAKQIYPDLNRRVEDIILHHMFPLVPVPPRSLEGFVVIMADKIVAYHDRFD